MDMLEKLVISSEATTMEANGETGHAMRAEVSQRRECGYTPAQLRHKFGEAWEAQTVQVGSRRIPIHMAVTPGGRRIPLLKAMLSTACERDCNYCSFRAGRSYKRISFTAEGFAKTFIAIYAAGTVDGLFLSGGLIRGGVNTQNTLLDAVEILRHRLDYRGYLHLKIMPGAERGQVEMAMRLADRVSVNLEAPNPERLACLAPSKHFQDELLSPLEWMEDIRTGLAPESAWKGRWPSSTTQFVVGAAGESDLEILNTVKQLNRSHGLARAYFEAFNPVRGTPLENHTPEDPLRQHRLYQASFLMRDYGFDLEDLPFSTNGRLPLARDPKSIYAQKTLSESPIEVNLAGRLELLRVPGIGPHSAAAIMRSRHINRFRALGDLRKIGILTERAAPYITLDGRRPARQLRLFHDEMA
jgi:predicted DNA-binding helix-hairpin-helix protein